MFSDLSLEDRIYLRNFLREIVSFKGDKRTFQTRKHAEALELIHFQSQCHGQDHLQRRQAQVLTVFQVEILTLVPNLSQYYLFVVQNLPLRKEVQNTLEILTRVYINLVIYLQNLSYPISLGKN